MKKTIIQSTILTLLILSPFYSWAFNLSLLLNFIALTLILFTMAVIGIVVYYIEDEKFRKALIKIIDKITAPDPNFSFKRALFYKAFYIIYSTIFGLWWLVVLYALNLFLFAILQLITKAIKEQLEKMDLWASN